MSLFLTAIASSLAAVQQPADATLQTAADQVRCPAVPGISVEGRDAVACDRFERPDAAVPGPDWTVQYGGFGISLGQCRSLANFSLMTHARAVAPWADARLSANFSAEEPGVVYVALVAGYASDDDCVFVKVQDNDADGLFDKVFFYRGNNGGPWLPVWGYPLAVPRAAGRCSLRFEGDGDVAVFQVEDEDGGGAEELRCAGVLGFGAALGYGLGLGGYGPALMDDFESDGGCAVGLRLLVTGLCPGVVEVGATGQVGEVAVFYGNAGRTVQQDPLRPCLGAALLLDRPWHAVTLHAGRPTVTFNAGWPVCGLSLQGVDLANCVVSAPVLL